jgi:DNA polymerase-3 subunit delta'
MLMARAFVRALVCPKAIDGCQCLSCRLVEAGTHPDVRVLSLGDESIKLEETRRLRESSVMSPLLSPYRLHLIDQADRLTAEACASLLKLLEEPPPAVVNILVSARPDALPATIRSRCLEIPFAYLAQADLTAHLRTRGFPEPELLARIAGGRMGEALRWGESEAWNRRRRYLEISWEVAAGIPSFAQSDSILKEKEKRAAIDFLRTLYCAWRDLSLWCVEPQAVVNTDQSQYLAQIAPRRPPAVWARGCRQIEDVLGLTTSPVNMGMLLPVLLFQLAQAEIPGTLRILSEAAG